MMAPKNERDGLRQWCKRHPDSDLAQRVAKSTGTDLTERIQEWMSRKKALKAEILVTRKAFSKHTVRETSETKTWQELVQLYGEDAGKRAQAMDSTPDPHLLPHENPELKENRVYCFLKTSTCFEGGQFHELAQNQKSAKGRGAELQTQVDNVMGTKSTLSLEDSAKPKGKKEHPTRLAWKRAEKAVTRWCEQHAADDEMEAFRATLKRLQEEAQPMTATTRLDSKPQPSNTRATTRSCLSMLPIEYTFQG